MAAKLALKIQDDQLQGVNGPLGQDTDSTTDYVMDPGETSNTEETANRNAPPKAQAVLTYKEIHPLALEGYNRLINYHTQQTPVVLKSWGTPEIVYDEIRNKLIDFNYSVEMAESMADKLVDHAIEHAETSRGKYNANLIALKLEVSKREPPTQFETGALEVQRIDGVTNKAEVAGATSIAMAIDTGGTTTTAVRDGVGEIIRAIGGTSNAVWLTFEAPDKSELQGLANHMAMGTIAQIGADALAPEQIEELLAQLNILAEAGYLSPEIANAITSLQQLQAQAATQSADGLKALSQSIIDDLSATLDGSPENIEMINSIVETMQTIATQHGLEAVIDTNGISQLKQDIQVVELSETLEAIAATLEGADQETLKALISEMSELEGNDLLNHLDTIQEQVATLNIPTSELAEINISIDGLKEIIPQNFSIDQKVEMLSAMSAQDLMDVLETLNSVENLPAELAEIMETLDIDSMSVEDIKQALSSQGDPAIAEAIKQVIVTLQAPEIQSALPQTALNQVNQFIACQSEFVDTVTAAVVISDLNSALSSIDVTSPEAATIQDVIQHLENGQTIDMMDAADLQVITEKIEQALENGDMQAVAEIMATENIDPAIVAKIIDTAQPLPAEAVAIISQTKSEVTSLLENSDLSTESIKQIEKAIETGNLNKVAEILATESVPAELSTQIVDVVQQISQNPEVQITQTKLEIASILDHTDINSSTMQKIEQAIDAGDMKAIAELVQAENITPATAAKIIDAIQPVSQDSIFFASDVKAEIVNLAQNSDINAESIKQIEQALDSGDMQAIAEIITAQNIDPAIAAKIIDAAQPLPTEAVNAISQAKIEVTSLLESSDICTETVKQIEHAIETGDINAITDLIASDPSASETVNNVLSSIAEGQQVTPLSAEAKTEMTQLIATISNSPDVATSPLVTGTLTQALSRGDISPATVSDIKASVGLATYGTQPVTATPSLVAPAVSQQLQQIANFKAPDNTSPVTPAAANTLQTVAQVVKKMDSPTAPATINEVVTAVQKLNEVKGLPPAQQAQVDAVKNQLVQSLPEAVRAEQQPMLAKTHTQAVEPLKNIPVMTVTQGDQQITLTRNDVEKLTEQFSTACDGNCAGCAGCTPKEDFQAASNDSASTHQFMASNENGYDNGTSSISLVADNSGNDSPFMGADNTPTQWVIHDNSNDNIITVSQEDMKDLTEVFRTACDGNCAGCNGCAVEQKQSAPAPAVA